MASDPKIAEVNEGIGLDSTGAVLAWVRCWGVEDSRRHELYRSADGLSFTKIASPCPDPFPVQVLDPVFVTELGLVSPWFAGNYHKDGGNSWGILVSTDDGRTWEQRTIESNLPVKEWVTESSIVSLWNGRILSHRTLRTGARYAVPGDKHGRRKNMDEGAHQYRRCAGVDAESHLRSEDGACRELLLSPRSAEAQAPCREGRFHLHASRCLAGAGSSRRRVRAPHLRRGQREGDPASREDRLLRLVYRHAVKRNRCRDGRTGAGALNAAVWGLT